MAQDDPSDATEDVDAAFRPGTHDVTLVRRHGDQSTVLDLGSGRRIFGGAGRFDGIAWSPDGRWLLVSWPTADEWVFVRSDGERIRATADVLEQFRSRTFRRVEGWCC